MPLVCVAYHIHDLHLILHFFFSLFIHQIIITAMDRFVWFVLLVVMSHLVTEFTRVSGYARGQRHELVLLNDVSMESCSLRVKRFTYSLTRKTVCVRGASIFRMN